MKTAGMYQICYVVSLRSHHCNIGVLFWWNTHNISWALLIIKWQDMTFTWYNRVVKPVGNLGCVCHNPVSETSTLWHTVQVFHFVGDLFCESQCPPYSQRFNFMNWKCLFIKYLPLLIFHKRFTSLTFLGLGVGNMVYNYFIKRNNSPAGELL